MRLMLRSDIAEAKFWKSKSDSEDPYRSAPNTDNLEPKRPKLLNDSVDAKFEKSNTETDDPTLEILNSANDEPKRA